MNGGYPLRPVASARTPVGQADHTQVAGQQDVTAGKQGYRTGVPSFGLPAASRPRLVTAVPWLPKLVSTV
jgi:hypothetical protein